MLRLIISKCEVHIMEWYLLLVRARRSVHDVSVTVTSHKSNECTFHSQLSQNVAKFMLIACCVSQRFTDTISHAIRIFIFKNH
jgi:hypothetical protein